MALVKALSELTLRELLAAVSTEQLRPASQLLDAVRSAFGLNILFTASMSDEITDHLRAGRLFAVGGQTTALAAQWPQFQVFNPATSTKTLLVFRLTYSTAATQDVAVKFNTAALLTLVNLGQALRRGDQPGVGELRSASAAALLGAASIVVARQVSADQISLLGPPDRPYLELPPGHGVVIEGQTVASTINVSAAWVQV